MYVFWAIIPWDDLKYKYLVPLDSLTDLRNAIRPFVEMDGFMKNGANEYCVHSIYYDTRSFDCYHEKLAGIQHRKKVRVRGYNEPYDDSYIFLEIKRKDNKLISKNRAPFLLKNFQPFFETKDIGKYIINGNGSSRAYDDARRFFYQVYRHSLSPVINIHYNREAYFYTFDQSVRITFDKFLRSKPCPNVRDLFRENPVRHSLNGFFILEIKWHDNSRGMPLWLEDIIGGFGLRKAALSKYCICLDEHRIPHTRCASPLRGEKTTPVTHHSQTGLRIHERFS